MEKAEEWLLKQPTVHRHPRHQVDAASIATTSSNSSSATADDDDDDDVEDDVDEVFNYNQGNRLISLAKLGDWPRFEAVLATFNHNNKNDFSSNRKNKWLDLSSLQPDEETGETLLMLAIRDHQLSVVKALLGLGVDASQQNHLNGTTALHCACSSPPNATTDVVAIVETLLLHRADPLATDHINKQLPLHLACQRHDLQQAYKIGKRLLKAMPYATRLMTDRNGNLPITYAIVADNLYLVQKLLRHYPIQQSAHWRQPTTANTHLHVYLSVTSNTSRDERMVRSLVAFGHADVNAQNANGTTPLHLAVASHDKQMVERLFSLKATASILDKNEESPLHVAARLGWTDAIAFMARRMKGDVSRRTIDGSTLMHFAAERGHGETVEAFIKLNSVPVQIRNKAGVTSLHLAAKNGHAQVVKALLERGTPVDARTKHGMTALHLAVLNNKPEVIQLLTGYGANVDLKSGGAGRHRRRNNSACKTALHIAAKRNFVECAKVLLISGAYANATIDGDNFETALHVASRRGYRRFVQLLLDEGANVHLLSRSGETALHLAVRHCHFGIVRTLLDHARQKYSRRDASHLVNLPTTTDGETTLHLVCELVQPRLHYDLEATDIASLLLRNGADVLATTQHTMENPLHYCARTGNMDVIQEIARFMGPLFLTLTNRQDKNGRSPLLTACLHGHAKIAELLINKGARVDLFDEQGSAALHVAAENGYISCCELLLKHKAFVNAKTKAGVSPLHLAAAAGFHHLAQLLIEKYKAVVDAKTLEKITPLHLAAKNGHSEVARTLIKAKALVTTSDSLGRNPLHLAAESDHPEVIKMFLKYNPELVFTATQDGMTCAHIAAAKGSVAVIKELMRFNRSIVVSARNKTTDSLPLHMAAQGGHGEVVRILLDAGSPPADENADGMTCLHLAAKDGHSSILGALPASLSWSIASTKSGLTPMHLAAFYGKADMVSHLAFRVSPAVASQKIAFSNVSSIKDAKLRSLVSADHGLTPVHCACHAGVDSVVRLLLNMPEVDVEARSATMQMTSLHLAAQTGSLKVSGLLLSKSPALLTLQDVRGLTPLHSAARSGKLEMVANLASQGSDVNALDYLGWSPLHHACRFGHQDVLKLLLELGANVTLETHIGRVPLSLAAASGHIDVFMFLLGQEHNTDKLLQDKNFVVDLMVCARANKQMAIREFILSSKSPLGTAAYLSDLFQKEARAKLETAKDFEAASRFCEKMTSSLMTISALHSSPSRILQATDTKGKPFIDTLLDENLKSVVAESAVQLHLTEIWEGNAGLSNVTTLLLFLAFVFFPPAIGYCMLPGSRHGYYRVPFVKFLAQFASHLQLIGLFYSVAVVPIQSLPQRSSFFPTWNEYLLLIWLGGNLTAELTNPLDSFGNRIIRSLILAFSALAMALQMAAITYDLESYEASILMYIRNQIFSIAVLLSVLFIVQFLMFHRRFGPLTIILNYIIQETGISTAIMMIFFVGWWLQLQAIYSPLCPDLEPELTAECICNVRVPRGCAPAYIASILHPGIPGCRSNEDFIATMTTNFQILYGALLHHGDYIWQTAVRNSGEWTTAFTRFHMSVFHILMVLTILTLIIATSADTYERMNRRSDLEWKFERARLIRNMAKMSSMPSPFNLLAKPFFYLRALLQWKGKLLTPRAPYYLALEEKILSGGDDFHVNLDDDDDDVERQNKSKLKAMNEIRTINSALAKTIYKLSFMRRLVRFLERPIVWYRQRFHKPLGLRGQMAAMSTIAAVSARATVFHRPTAELLVQEVEGGRGEKLLRDVIDWRHVVERYREIEAEDADEDEYIKELGCYLSELDEWQTELWEEAEEMDGEEEREIFRNWLIEEFKEVIRS